jgi:hypothetical protein
VAFGVRTRPRRRKGGPDDGRAVGTLPDTLAGRRDRALLLVGFAAALRRVELAPLRFAPALAPIGSRLSPTGSKSTSGQRRRTKKATPAAGRCAENRNVRDR